MASWTAAFHGAMLEMATVISFWVSARKIFSIIGTKSAKSRNDRYSRQGGACPSRARGSAWLPAGADWVKLAMNFAKAS
eukprot:6293482-Lingulodinium_polyedra.AAC.1